MTTLTFISNKEKEPEDKQKILFFQGDTSIIGTYFRSADGNAPFINSLPMEGANSDEYISIDEDVEFLWIRFGQ